MSRDLTERDSGGRAPLVAWSWGEGGDGKVYSFSGGGRLYAGGARSLPSLCSGGAPPRPPLCPAGPPPSPPREIPPRLAKQDVGEGGGEEGYGDVAVEIEEGQ